jgi:hypothetical protein
MKSLLVAAVLILLSSAAVFSQNPPGGPPPIDRRTNTDRVRQQDMSSREWQLRNFGREAGAPKNKLEVEALMAQTEEDFNRILTLHNEIARAIASDNAIDYRFVSEATSEIKKRASRVQSSLHLGLSSEDAAGAEQPKKFGEREIKEALITLCRQIRSFVTNPVIENPNTIDAKEALRARRDLDNLIQLSGEIKKDADSLSKN